MNVNLYSIILTLKNLGSFLAAYTLADIKTDYTNFFWALLIYILINVPTDLLVVRKINNDAKKEVRP